MGWDFKSIEVTDAEWGDRWDSRLSLPCFDFREHLALPMPLNEFAGRAWSVWNHTEAAPCLITGKEFLCTRLLVDVTLGRRGGTASHKQIPQGWIYLIRPGPLWNSRDHFPPLVESPWRTPGKCLASPESCVACWEDGDCTRRALLLWQAGVLGSSSGLCCRWWEALWGNQGIGKHCPQPCSHPNVMLNIALCRLAPAFQDFARMFYTRFLISKYRF